MIGVIFQKNNYHFNFAHLLLPNALKNFMEILGKAPKLCCLKFRMLD